MIGNNQSFVFNSAGQPTTSIADALARSRLLLTQQSVHFPPRSPLPRPAGSLFLLGLGDFEDFNGVDILKFVKEHNLTLNFPQKVKNFSLKKLIS
jgi:hypothetical protein